MGGRLALCDPPLGAEPQLEGRCPALEDQISRDTACARVLPKRSVERPATDEPAPDTQPGGIQTTVCYCDREK